MLSSEPSCSRGWIIATDSLPKHRTKFWLNCPVWCEPLPESFFNCLAEVRCPMPFVASATGSTSRSGSVSNCACSRIAVSMEQLLPTYRGAVFRSARSPDDHTCVQPHLEICSFQGRTLLPLVRGHLRSPVSLHGTASPQNSMENSLSLLTFRKKNWKLIYLSPKPKLSCVMWLCLFLLLTMLLWLFRKACKKYNNIIIIFHPQSNEFVEVFHYLLKKSLKRLRRKGQRLAGLHRPVPFCQRGAIHESTGFAPFEVVFGKSVRGGAQILRQLSINETIKPEGKTTHQLVLDLRSRKQ